MPRLSWTPGCLAGLYATTKRRCRRRSRRSNPGRGIGLHAALVRGGVARLFTENGVDVVAQTGNGDDLLACVRDLCPDVALVDVRMPPTYADEGI